MRRKRSTDIALDDELETKAPRSRRRRWPLYGIALLVLLFFAPNLIGWSGVHRWIVPWVTSDFQGQIEVDRVSMGWLDPVSVGGIRVFDTEGQPLAEVESVTASRSLLSWLTGGEWGKVRIVRPNVLVSVTTSGSNWEEALAVYLEQWLAPGDTQPMPPLVIEWQDGQITLVEPSGATLWQARQLEGAVTTSAPDQPLTIQCAAVIQETIHNGRGEPQLLPPGGMALEAAIDAGAQELTWSQADIQLQAESLPLGWASPVISRLVIPASLEGRIDGALQSRINLATLAADLQLDQLRGQQLQVRCRSILGDDVIRLEQWAGKGQLRLTDSELAARQFAAETDLGNVRADGRIRFEDLTGLVQQGRLPESPLKVDGRLDLAQVAKVLPQTLQLHDDLVLESGELSFQFNHEVQQQTPRLVFNLDTVNLNATRAGKAIIWAKPIRLVGTVTQADQWLAVENLRCESEFLEMEGNGGLRSAAFRVTGDLARLTDRLGQFVNLQGTRLEGTIDGKFGWQLAESAPIGQPLGSGPLPLQLGGSFQVQRPLIAWPDAQPWQEDQLELKFSASGKANVGPDASLVRWQMDQGGLQLQAGTESAIVTLSQPIEDLFGEQPLRADCRLSGQLANWLAHVRRWVDPGVQASGNLTLTTAVAWTPQAIEFDGAQYQVQQLAWDGWGARLQESQVHGDLTGRLDLSQGEFRIPDVTLIASSLAARGRDLRFGSMSPWLLDGQVAYRANVNRVADWFQLSPDNDSVFWFGTAEGSVRWSSQRDVLAMHMDAKVADMVAAKLIPPRPGAAGQSIIQVGGVQRQWDALWQDPEVKLSGQVNWTSDFDGLELIDTRVDAQSLSATISGKITDLWASMESDLRGTWQPDWSLINGLLAAYSGELARFEGGQPQSFELRGPLFPKEPQDAGLWVARDLSARANLGWQRGQLLGLPVGAADWQVQLDRGIATAKSEGVPFAGGQLKLEPTIDLTSADPMLTSGWTRIVDDVSLEAETARHWLRYVAPLAAEATSAEGRFTVDLGEAQVPLLRPSEMQARGAIKMRDVVIGAGPLAQQLLTSIEQVRRLIKPEARQRNLATWVKIPEQTIPIVVRDGRVFHDQVKFVQGDIAFQTRGSIGLDQTLNLVVELAIADDWIAGKPYLAGLRGKSLQLPITGTVSQPRVDTSAAERLSAQLFQSAAQGAVQGAVDEKLQPRINQIQDKLNSEIQGQFNKLQNGLQEKLGIGNSPLSGGQPTPNGNQPAPSLVPAPGAFPPPGELFQGLGDLLRRKDPQQAPSP